MKPNVTTEATAEINRLQKEVSELRKANGILKAASIFFAKELDRRAAASGRNCRCGRVGRSHGRLSLTKYLYMSARAAERATSMGLCLSSWA